MISKLQFQGGIILLTILILLAGGMAAKPSDKLQKVPRIVYEVYPNEWYLEQQKLWEKEIQKNPHNPEAWYNYYNSVRYARFVETQDTPDKKSRLDKIIEDMGKMVPDSYEYFLLKYWNSYNLFDISLVEKAYKINPDRPDTYYPFISHYEVTGNEKGMREFCQKLYDSRDIAPWLLNYNYNVLMSTEKNAILFTNGDNDTYPVWVLQKALGIRPDVTVLNVSLSPVESYLENNLKEKNIHLDITELKQASLIVGEQGEKTFSRSQFVQNVCRAIADKYPQYPIYFALTVYSDNITDLKDDLFVVGLAYRYSRERIDNLAFIKKNLENNFRLDYLKYDWYSEDYLGERLSAHLQMNYVVPMVMLAEHYKISGNEGKANRWKNLALEIARKAGKDAELIKDLSEKGL
ncbi:MAG: hypothetical protein Kow0042_18070 [Calditrichia bacterium]